MIQDSSFHNEISLLSTLSLLLSSDLIRKKKRKKRKGDRKIVKIPCLQLKKEGEREKFVNKAKTYSIYRVKSVIVPAMEFLFTE